MNEQLNPQEWLDRVPSEDEIRDELADTLKRADALREMLKVRRKIDRKAKQQQQ